MGAEKTDDLIGPGVGDYEQLLDELPRDYEPLISPREVQRGVAHIKAHVEAGLCRELGLERVEAPLILERDTGLNDSLDSSRRRTAVDFQAGLGLRKRIDAQVVQGASKWKRQALAQFGFGVGEGLLADVRAIAKDHFLDHDHSAYVDQWDWERVVSPGERDLATLRDAVRAVWRVMLSAEAEVRRLFPQLTARHPPLPREVTFLHAEQVLARHPELSRTRRETAVLQEHGAVFIIGVGHVLDDGYPHELRAPDYDDWISPTVVVDGVQMHGLNGDLLVWNPVTRRRHQLSSMAIRVTPESLRAQLQVTDQLRLLRQPYHRRLAAGELPLSMGGGVGQSRLYMYLLRRAHIGECSVTVWPRRLREMCAQRGIHVLT